MYRLFKAALFSLICLAIQPVSAMAETGIVACAGPNIRAIEARRVYDFFSRLKKSDRKSEFEIVRYSSMSATMDGIQSGTVDGFVFFSEGIRISEDGNWQGMQPEVIDLAPGTEQLDDFLDNCAIVDLGVICGDGRTFASFNSSGCPPGKSYRDRFAMEAMGVFSYDNQYNYKFAQFDLSVNTDKCRYGFSHDFSEQENYESRETKSAWVFDAKFDETGNWNPAGNVDFHFSIFNGFVTRSVINWFDSIDGHDGGGNLQVDALLNRGYGRKLSFSIAFDMDLLRRNQNSVTKIYQFDFSPRRGGENVTAEDAINGLLELRTLKISAWDSDQSFKAPISKDILRVKRRALPIATLKEVRKIIQTHLGESCFSAESSPKIVECDKYAATPSLADEVSTPTVRFYNMDARKAIYACAAASKAFPDHRRTQLNLGRAMDRRSDAQPELVDRSQAIFKTLCDEKDGRISAFACNNVGVAHHVGSGSKSADSAQALRYYRLACDLGEPWGCANMGSVLSLEKNPDYNPEQAGKVLTKACRSGNEEGNAYACLNLGYVYQVGRGVFPPSISKATKSYRLACDLKYPLGCYYAGAAYQKKSNPERNITRALNLYRTGCDISYGKGSGRSCNAMAKLLEAGKVSPKKTDKSAYVLYTRACRLDYAWGCYNAGEILLARDDKSVLKKQKIVRHYHDGCLLKDGRASAKSCYTMGLIYEHGSWGKAPNKAKAIQFYDRGCGLKNKSSCGKSEYLASQ